MRRFVVEALVEAVIVLVTILVLSVPSVGQPFPFGPESAPILQLRGAGIPLFLLAATILVVTKHFVRPVIVAFTGRWLLSTMGLFLVIVNAIVIWVAAFIAPDIATIAAPSVLWLLVFSAIYTLLSTVVGALLGTNRPQFLVDGTTPRMWRMLESLPTPRRNVIIENLRLQQIYEAVYAVALDSALARTPVGGFRLWFSRTVLGEEDLLAGSTGPERFRMLLQQLGPTYVKIGQMIASRERRAAARGHRRALEAPERRGAVPLGGCPGDDPLGARQGPRGAVRVDRP